ncbi:Uncharacterized protein FWK35_00026893, partial [Aphis craccivora]
ECKSDNEKPLCQKAFDNIFFKKNLSIFSPKKDQCDKCCQYNLKNLPEEDTNESINYWFDESQTELVASTFVSCLIDVIEETLKKSLKPVIIYSDDCTVQNRNCVMSNALLHLCIKYDVTITQKFLEKGHTQMEYDSVHSVIERKLKKTDCYLPSQLSQITKEARIYPFPYTSKLLTFNFFSDYSNKKLMFYESIRPGRVALIFLMSCQEGQTKLIKKIFLSFPNFINTPKKISLDKWNDLQSLKSIMPYDCHCFYDALPYMNESVHKAKKKSKE